MAVVAAYSNASNGVTATGLQDFPGHRLVIALFDRSGGETASIDTSDPNLTAAIVQVGAEVTDPTNGTNRRSLFLFEAIVPAGVGNNPIITPTVLDGASNPVDASIQAAVAEEGASYALAEVVSDNSAGALVTSQGTGTTPAVAAGDILAIAVETTRGATTATWTLTDNTPPNPGGGDWTLSITSGTGASQRRGSVGYYVEAAAASQMWTDTATYGTTRMASALIAVWTTGTGGGQVTFAGTADSVSDAEGSMAVARALSGSGDGAGDATGSLSRLRALTGAADNVTDSDGILAVRRNLAGSSDTVSAGVGDLTVEGSSQVSFAGTADTASDATGTLSMTRLLAGSADAVSDAVGTLGAGLDFVPELTGTVIVRGLKGSVTASSLGGSATVQGLAGTVG